jgi:pimeloyl-ACP methyl ester carboxylesterase
VVASGIAVAATPGSGTRIETRVFWSDVLNKAVKTEIILPPGYSSANVYPSLYLLHGSANESGNDFGAAILEMANDVGARGFVGIVPYTGAAWTNPKEDATKKIAWEIEWPAEDEPILGINRGGVTAPKVDYTAAQAPYETHVINELIPWVTANYSVARDRKGRGVMGHSGGAFGSFMLATRHPDLFSFVGGSSGPVSAFHPSCLEICTLATAAWGGRDFVTDEIFWRAKDPKELSVNLLGEGLSVIHSAGCPNAATEAGDPTCGLEGFAQPLNRDLHNKFDAIGLPHTYVIVDVNTHAVPEVAIPVYKSHYLPLAASTFAAPPSAPKRWTYKTIDRAFRLWGWSFGVERPNTEFLTLQDVEAKGFTALGTGDLLVVTPPIYRADTRYRLTRTAPGGSTFTTVVYSDDTGRLAFAMELGAPRLMDEHSILVSAGMFPFPAYRLAIVADRTTRPDDPRECPAAWVYPVAPC